MLETLVERNYRSVAAELVTHFNDELEFEKPTLEIIKSLEFKLIKLSELYEEAVINGALELLKNTDEPLGKILVFALKNEHLKASIKKNLN